MRRPAGARRAQPLHRTASRCLASIRERALFRGAHPPPPPSSSGRPLAVGACHHGGSCSQAAQNLAQISCHPHWRCAHIIFQHARHHRRVLANRWFCSRCSAMIAFQAGSTGRPDRGHPQEQWRVVSGHSRRMGVATVQRPELAAKASAPTNERGPVLAGLTCLSSRRPMPEIRSPFTIGVSTRALLDLREEHEVFEREGVQA